MFEGTTIGGYRVVQQIGAGGMGAVFLAEHVMLGRRAAIKILHPEFSRRAEIVARFFNEARAATAISDPGIIQIFDFGHHTDGSAYIVMELLDGEPLDKRLRQQGAMSVYDTLRIMRQVAGSLGAAHARGIVHRDLKPENIFIVRDPEVAGGERAKLLDFGIAKLTAEMGGSQTSTSVIMGTPQYMSPEQCRGAGKVDQRSDVYSLGCVMYSLLTGNVPFNAEGTGELIVMHMTEPPMRPSTRAYGVPPVVDELILRCLAKQPEDRYQSGAELSAAIGQALASLTSPPAHAAQTVAAGNYTAPSPTTLGSSVYVGTGTQPPPPKRRTALVAGIGVLVGGGAIAAIVVASSGDKPAAPPPPEPAEQPVAKPEPAPEPAPKPEPKPDESKDAMKVALAAFAKWAPSHGGEPCPTAETIGLAPDPWGHPFVVTCSDQPANQIIGLVSHGPDGQADTEDDLLSWSMGKDVTDLVRGARWKTMTVAQKPPKLDKPPTRPDRPSRPDKPAGKPAGKPDPAKGNPVDLDGDGIPDKR